MSANDLIDDLRTQLERVKAQGQAVVGIQALEDYLRAQEANASATTGEALARARHDLEVWKVRAPLMHETARWAIEAGGDALRTLVLVNGGAAVALLAFLGNILTKEPVSGAFSLPTMKVAMLTFVFGVGFAGVSSAARYLTQLCAAEGWTKTAYVFTAVAILVGLASLGAFFRGGLFAFWAFG